MLKGIDVLADLMNALDELNRPSRGIHSHLTDAADLDAESEDGFYNTLLQVGLATGALPRARMRADTKNAHEAIEKGLKAILVDSGRSVKQVKKHGHHLDKLLMAVRRYCPMAFLELERCFDATIQYLEFVTPIQHNTDIVDYFQKHGKGKVFTTHRYASIDGDKIAYGMIGFVYREIIRALLSLISGRCPQDIDSRIEEEARKAVLAESRP